MTNLIPLDKVDTDGAIREAAEAAGLDRRNFLRNGAVAGGGIVAGGAFFGVLDAAEARISTRKKSKSNDIKILNYALTLEFLEAEFYKQAFDKVPFGAEGQLRLFTRVVAEHEKDHVVFLRKALGSKAVKKPSFDFGETVTDVNKFRTTAQVLEDTGVRAYLGQVANISQGPVLTAAGTIATVEARHASWIRFLNGGGETGSKSSDQPAPFTFDKPAKEATVLRAVLATGFIED